MLEPNARVAQFLSFAGSVFERFPPHAELNMKGSKIKPSGMLPVCRCKQMKKEEKR
jgi:hypothetical protein